MAMGSSQGVVVPSQSVVEGTVRTVGAMHGQNTQNYVREKVMASKSSDAW